MSHSGISINYRLTVPGHLLNPPQKTNPSNGGCIVSQIAASHLSTLTGSSTLQGASQTCCNNSLCEKIRNIWNAFRATVYSCFSKIYYFIRDCFTTAFPAVNHDMSKETLRKLYWGLGVENKWRECIDGRYHHLGKEVFDRGLHRGTVEPGFIRSMEGAFPYVETALGTKIDADWYLNLHRLTCSHFNGDPAVYLMGQEGVGLFRNTTDYVHCALTGHYRVSAKAKAEFEALDASIRAEFGPAYGIGEMIYTDTAWESVRLNYRAMSRDQIRQIFNKFLNEFYAEVERATDPDAKLMAIARLHQRLEWLHPVKDGTARTSTALMNKLLTDYGFHPAILEYPHVSSSYTLEDWKQYLQKGLVKWERERARLSF